MTQAHTEARRRVVVTGLGFVTPIGNDLESVWSSLVEGVSGVGPITHFDTTQYSTKIAAEVRGFEPERYMDRKTARHLGRYCQFARPGRRSTRPAWTRGSWSRTPSASSSPPGSAAWRRSSATTPS